MKSALLLLGAVAFSTGCLRTTDINAPENITYFAALQLDGDEVIALGALRPRNALFEVDEGKTIILGFSEAALLDAFIGDEVPVGVRLALADVCDSTLPAAEWVKTFGDAPGPEALPPLRALGLKPKCEDGGQCIDGACPGEVIDISVGSEHACLVLQEGEIYCFGNNKLLRTGHGGLEPLDSANIVSSIGVAREVAAGLDHTCARTDEEIYCFGSGLQRQLGPDSTYALIDVPILVASVESPRGLVAGYHHSCALGEGGEVVCWGDNSVGQLGELEGSGQWNLLSDLPPVERLVSGSWHTCAINAEGALYCWGHDGDGKRGARQGPAPSILIAEGVKDAAAGARHTCALLEDDQIRCFGSNSFGQSTEPVFEEPLASISAAGHTNCVRTRSGRAFCWGDNRLGQLQLDELVFSEMPVEVFKARPSAKIEAVSVGDSSVCSLSDGVAHCWGDGGHGALGSGERAVIRSPTPLGLKASSIAVSGDHGCAVQERQIYCWGRNDYGQVGKSPSRFEPLSPVSIPGAGPFVQVAVGELFSCARTMSGEVYCFGDDRWGQLGGSPEAVQPFKVDDIGRQVIDIAATRNFACALDEGLSLHCWGAGDLRRAHGAFYGSALSDTEEGIFAYPVEGPVLLIPDDAELLAYQLGPVEDRGAMLEVASGQVHSCARLNDGDVLCFGFNPHFQMGVPEQSEESFSARVGLSDVIAIGAGENSSCALFGGGSLSCWGSDAYGILGRDGENGLPERIAELFGVVRIAMRRRMACAVTENETYCWGINNYGQAAPSMPPHHEARLVDGFISSP